MLDFTKAFDKVPHQRLLKKMEYYGIRGPLLNWFTSFLSERQQTVICEGRSSTSASVSSGVPQGTVLAPLLFLLYINDLPDSINSTVRLFADDVLLYGVISNDADGEQIQNDLIRLEQWQTIWQMNFNPAKCKVICFSIKRDPPKKVYKLCGVILEEVQSIPYLGLTLDKKLKWSNHIQNITTNANRTLGLMRRNFWNCPREIKEITYKTIVRPKLEYASAAWDPYLKKDIAKVEKVQRKAARFCTGNYKQTASVTDMIKELDWETLELRRTKCRLNMMYKLSHKIVNFDTSKHLVFNSEKRTRGSHNFKYVLPKINKDVFKYSFFPRTIKDWNSLPSILVNTNSYESFKLKLEDFYPKAM